MTPLHLDPHYTFRFAEDRLIPRFHLDGVEPGSRVAVYRLDPVTGGTADLLVRAVASDDGWVSLSEPLVVRAGEGFVAVPEADVVIHDDSGLRFTALDRYDRPLTFTTPENIRRLVVSADTAAWDRAILAFLLALPPDARIVLYWC